jgi:protein arginine N-methyltransferase 1
MFVDKARIGAYAKALQQKITSESVVVDIGAGTGIFSLLACMYGARRVYAVEPNGAIQLARDIAEANGFADRIVCFQDLSTNVTIEEPADVVISDLSGVLPYHERNIASVIDARRRLLAPAGQLIPQEDRLRAVVVEAPDAYNKLTAPWGTDFRGLDMSAGRKLALNTWGGLPDKPFRLLSEPLTLAKIDYETVEDPNLSAATEWIVTSDGTGHGVTAWFDRTVSPGIEISNAPGAAESVDVSRVYGRAFLPWEEPVLLHKGDAVFFKLRAVLIGEDYTWAWETRVQAYHNDKTTRARFWQASILGEALTPETLKRQRGDFIPQRNEEAEVDLLVL